MLRRIALCVLAAGFALGLGSACGDDQPSPNSSNRGEQLPTPTSGDVPHNNPSSGETGTDGTDTGSR